jgi:hypothetical protein
MPSYDGQYSREHTREEMCRVERGERIRAVGDQHTGYDILISIGDYIVSAAPTSRVWLLPGPPDEGERRVHTLFREYLPTGDGTMWGSTYGHLNTQLVMMDQMVYRGQIIGLAGNSAAWGSFLYIPQLHFDLARSTGNGWYYTDPYRHTVHLDPLPANFWGSEASYWTKDNDPQFPLVSVGD